MTGLWFVVGILAWLGFVVIVAVAWVEQREHAYRQAERERQQRLAEQVRTHVRSVHPDSPLGRIHAAYVKVGQSWLDAMTGPPTCADRKGEISPPYDWSMEK